MSTNNEQHLEHIGLHGLEVAPPQVWGGIRIVPVLRRAAPGDLRLALRSYEDDCRGTHVDVSQATYTSFIPHAFVAEWTADGDPVAAFGTQLGSGLRHEKVRNKRPWQTRTLRRMAKREDRRRLRMLPLHMAMEGFLALHFRGPEMAWPEYSRAAKRDGLGVRSEMSIGGRAIRGLEQAMRVFEIHEDQVGVLVFVADALASAFVVPHPNDFRLLRTTLLQDFYAELLFYYGLYATENVIAPERINSDRVNSIDDLRREVQNLRADWVAMSANMARGILDRPATAVSIRRMGQFHLQRFMTALNQHDENHIGELISRHDGTLEYLKTYRLSGKQTKRAFLLSQLAAADWNLDACAQQTGSTRNELVRRMENAGFGYLLNADVLIAARKTKQ